MSKSASAHILQTAAQDVTKAPSGILQRKCTACNTHTTAGDKCDECKKGSLQRKSSNSSEISEVPPIVHEVLNSSGQPLDKSTRSFFESRFSHNFSKIPVSSAPQQMSYSSLSVGEPASVFEQEADHVADSVMQTSSTNEGQGGKLDLSQVRIHNDERAAQSASAVNALAYTVGNNIVFGAGQFAPTTHPGQRLIAHELTHVLQQGQGVLQRTPAPPTHNSVTGVRDLNRIRIDAVPDFLASSLTAPRVVNAYISDPAVVHMSWEFYDPADTMMPGSFSTGTGNPGSTTTPFTLQPSHFSGAGFVAGKYLLRCVGRNAAHEPIVYADRDFNVLSADLTTGTALPTTYGELTFTTYNKTDANPPTTPRYSVNVELRFLPATTVSCNQIGFIQSMQTIDNTGRSQQNTVNSEQDARKTPLAWSIDRLAGTPTPFYGTESSGGAITIPASKGAFGAGGATPTAASLIDRPSWNRSNNAKFESCAVCRSSGASNGQVYGCATWGYTANSAGQVTMMPRSFRQMPSAEFTEAHAAWNTWRTSVPTATRPEAAPALTSP